MLNSEWQALIRIKLKFQIPTGNFLLMIILSLCINITEGTMADWTSVFMRDFVKTNRYYVMKDRVSEDILF